VGDDKDGFLRLPVFFVAQEPEIQGLIFINYPVWRLSDSKIVKNIFQRMEEPFSGCRREIPVKKHTGSFRIFVSERRRKSVMTVFAK